MSEQVVLFPPELVARVKAEYPNYPKLHEALDMGDRHFISRTLAYGGTELFHSAHIKLMIDSGRVRELLEEAETVVRCNQLHSDWVGAVYTEKDREQADQNRP